MADLFVLDEGRPDGRPVLLVHGFASSLRAWDALVPLLSADFRMLRADLLGHGRTGGAAADAVVQAEALSAVLDGKGLADVTVVGHSYGADVALALAASTDRVSRVVILAQGPDYTDASVPQVRFLISRPGLTRRLYAALRPGFGVLSRPLCRLPVIRQALRDLRTLDPAMVRIVLADRRATLAASPLDTQLAAIGRPALVVLGSRDRLYGDRAAARYRAAGARVEIIAESGHAMPQQHPARVAALLRDFTA